MAVELLDLKNDFVFKQVFGTEENKDILISFINAVIRAPVIKDITLTNTEITKLTLYSRTVHLDIKATADDGTLLDIEIQCRNTGEIIERAIYYMSAMMVENALTKTALNNEEIRKQLGISIENTKDFHLCIHHSLENISRQMMGYKNPRVISIWILNADIYKDRKSYIEEITMCYKPNDKDNYYEQATDKVRLFLLTLPKFNPKTEVEKSQKDLLVRWMSFLKEPKTGEGSDVNKIEKAYKVLARASLDKSAKDMLEAEEKGLSIKQAEYEYELLQSKEKGKAEGIAEGIAAGIEEGIAKGKAAGIEEGESRAKIEMAKNLLSMGMSIEQISVVTSLSIEEVKQLQA